MLQAKLTPQMNLNELIRSYNDIYVQIEADLATLINHIISNVVISKGKESYLFYPRAESSDKLDIQTLLDSVCVMLISQFGGEVSHLCLIFCPSTVHTVTQSNEHFHRILWEQR